MIIHLTDGQVVGETVATMFSFIQQGPVSALIVLKNSGTNTLNYRFQEWNGTTWVDLGASGSDYYNTIIASDVRSFKLTSNYPKVQLLANASGGAFLDFSVTRYADRPSGGPIPILTL